MKFVNSYEKKGNLIYPPQTTTQVNGNSTKYLRAHTTNECSQITMATPSRTIPRKLHTCANHQFTLPPLAHESTWKGKKKNAGAVHCRPCSLQARSMQKLDKNSEEFKNTNPSTIASRSAHQPRLRRILKTLRRTRQHGQSLTGRGNMQTKWGSFRGKQKTTTSISG